MTTGPTFWPSILPEPDQGRIQARRRATRRSHAHIAGRQVDAGLAERQGGRLDRRSVEDLNVDPGSGERRLELQAYGRTAGHTLGGELILPPGMATAAPEAERLEASW